MRLFAGFFQVPPCAFLFNQQNTGPKQIDKALLVVQLFDLLLINGHTSPFHTEYVSVYQTRDGKLSYYRIYEDSLKLYRAYFKEQA